MNGAGSPPRERLPPEVRTTPARREFDDLASYFTVLRAFPPLGREEEHATAVRAVQGDLVAKQKLARHNLRLVVAVARKQARGAVRLEDIIQEGSIGLLRAVEKFDPDAGTRFSTYAMWWIRAFIGRYLRQTRSNVRPKSGTVAREDLSLNASIGGDDDVSYLDLLKDDGPDPERRSEAAQRDRQVKDALEKVRGRIGPVGWDIIRLRLQRDSPATLREIGDRWTISRERVRQIEVVTKRFLRTYLEDMRLAGCVGGDHDAAPHATTSEV
jgi:RNA polymerase sigma factor (sigma-70 family)